MNNLKFTHGLALAVLLSLTSLFSTVNAQTHTARYISMTGNTNAFYEYLPQGYNASGSATYPTIIFIHGVGELGQGNSSSIGSLLGGGIPGLINRGGFPTSVTVGGQTHKFIVISPQFVNWPDGAQIGRIIDYAKANYKVDASRIYVTGLSMGGGVTWQAAAMPSNVNRIAALVPIAGASWPGAQDGRTIANANLPVWAFHNQGDGTVGVENTNAWISSINAAPAPNPAARKTIFNVGGHDSWTQAYNPSYKEDGKNVYEWMLQFTTARSAGGAAPPQNVNPVVNAGPDMVLDLPASSAQLNGSASDPDGSIASYQWSFAKVAGSGTLTFSNATVPNPVISNLTAGVYHIRLTATDNKGASVTDDFQLTVYPDKNASSSTTANAGNDLTVNLPSTSVQLSGSATAASGTSITSSQWTVRSGPAGSNFSSASNVNTLISSLSGGVYIIRLTVTDNTGNSAWDDMAVSVLGAPPVTSTAQRFLKVKVYGGSFAYSNNEWNNWNIGAGGHGAVTSPGFTYTDGTPSSIRSTLTQSNDVTDNGDNYGAGMAPKEVLRHTSYSTQDRTLTISGLVASAVYDLEFYASRGTNVDNNTIFVVNGLRKEVPTLSNYTNKAKFSGIAADGSGNIVVTVTKSAYYSYLNGFMITEGSSASSASVSRSANAASPSALTAQVVDLNEIAAAPATTQDRTAIRLNNNRSGKFSVTVADLEGKVVKELSINKAQPGITQSYISLNGLAAGQYVVIATQDHYTEAVLVTKL